MRNGVLFLVLTFLLFPNLISAQRSNGVNWTPDGLAYTKVKGGNIVRVDPATEAETILVTKEQLTPAEASEPLSPQSYSYSADKSKILLFVNTVKVWRYKTKGDYWLLDLVTGKLQQIGKDRPARSLMFAKFSPDSKMIAYVSEHNIFVEDIATRISRMLTSDGTRKLINGTFDWVYEEEFGCRDGFRWSPDSKQIAF